MDTYAKKRRKMVDHQISPRGVSNRRVLHALREFTYEDPPLPIEEGQTISQPYIVALMAEALGLGADDRVLEIAAEIGVRLVSVEFCWRLLLRLGGFGGHVTRNV
jgi:protein-L-isoaspartate O-methyltransferase